MGETSAVASVAPAGVGDSLFIGEFRRRAMRGGALLFATRLAIQILTWSVTIVVARFLRPYDYGVLTAGGILIGLSDMLADAEVGKALIQKPRLDPEDIAVGFTFSLILSLMLYVALYFLAVPAAVFFHNEDLVAFIRVAGLTLWIVPFRAVSLALLERRLLLAKQALIHTITSIVSAAMVLSLAVAGFGFWSIVAGTMLSRILEAALLTAYTGWRPSLMWPRWARGGVLSFSIHASAGTLLWFLYSNADFAIVSRLCGPIELGYYSFVFTIISIPVFRITNNVNLIAYPIYCRIQDQPERLRLCYLRILFLTELVGMPALMGMNLVSDDLTMVVFGQKWMPIVAPLRILSFAGILMMISTSLVPILTSLGRPDINLRYNIVNVALLPACFYLAGSYGGIIGICWVWVVAYPFMIVGLLTSTRGITGIKVFDIVRSLTPIVIATLIMTGAVQMTRSSMASADVPAYRLVAAISCGIASYALAIWMLARRTALQEVRFIYRELRSR